jgi:protein subunit release factor A
MFKLEIKASEGGQDSKLLVHEMTNIYKKACKLENYNILKEEYSNA